MAARPLVAATEHNIEDLLLCLEGMRSEDVPHMNWDWDRNQWQPDLLRDDHYPQCYKHDTPSGGADFHILWSVPLCGRSQQRDWNDAEHYFRGQGRQALIFDYQLSTAATRPGGLPPRLLADSISVSLAMVEGTPLRKLVKAESGNKIRVDMPLLIEIARTIDELKAYLALERQALEVLHRRSHRDADRALHTNE